MPLPPIDTLNADRLHVRAVRADDLADLMAINGDAEVTRFLPYATWQSPADGQAWLERMNTLVATGSAHQLVIVRNADHRVVGTVLLFKFDAGSRRLELGYVMGRAHWRQGYTAEALRAVLSHAFGPMRIRRIEAEVNPANEASNRLLRTLGFTHEGFLRERWEAKGACYGVNVYGLLATEWPAATA
ncbi:MAG: GNAT family N-acetyltransferase [Burkholderiales bacterium]|nr:GNAT family N-acetyltransferase [Burkholderiales bacterium]